MELWDVRMGGCVCVYCLLNTIQMAKKKKKMRV